MKEVIINTGIPGSGKSTWVKKDSKIRNKPFLVLSADSIREEMYGDAKTQGDGKVIFQILYDRLRRALLTKTDLIYIDNTSTTRKARKAILDIIEKTAPDTKVYFKVFTNFEQAREQNKNRDRVVPDEVLNRMEKQFEMPSENESFLDITILK